MVYIPSLKIVLWHLNIACEFNFLNQTSTIYFVLFYIWKFLVHFKIYFWELVCVQVRIFACHDARLEVGEQVSGVWVLLSLYGAGGLNLALRDLVAGVLNGWVTSLLGVLLFEIKVKYTCMFVCVNVCLCL